jgi:hypothetical protein
MTNPSDGRNSSQEEVRDSIGDVAGRRGTDERREAVDPAQNPAPSSPKVDQEALRKSEETLERVKPY